MPKPTPVIQKAINTERKAEVWEMKVRQGMSVKGIADLMGFSTATIYAILRDIIRTAQETLEEDVFRWKLEQHYKYDHLYAESMAAWESSKSTFQRNKAKKMPRIGKDGKVDVSASPDLETTITTENRSGDSRYLNAAIAALQAQAKLWGMNAPDMIETTNRTLQVTATIGPADAMDAVAAAEAAFRAKKYGQRITAHSEETIDGQLTARAIPEVTGDLVSDIREDHDG